MEQTSVKPSPLERILELLSERAPFYETGVQTTVYWKAPSGRQNLLTKLEFVSKGEKSPTVLAHEYRDIVIVRRLLSHMEIATLLKHLVTENLLEIGHDSTDLAFQGRFQVGGETRSPQCERTMPGCVQRRCRCGVRH